MAAEDGDAVYVLARIAARADAGDAERASRRPVNLALVLDRSSSMRGPRVEQAMRAVREVVYRLDARDRLSLITFDATARAAFGPRAVDDDARAELLEVLGALDTGLGTNLAAGWRKGAEAVASGFLRDAVSRVVLLTDGQPSVGVTDADRLAELAGQAAARGIATTAMGIGESFDDELLTNIARSGRGGFYYLATADSIPAAFGAELEGVFAVAATQAELKLKLDAEVMSAEILHRIPARPLDDGLAVELGDIAAGPPRQVLFKLQREPGARSRRVGTLALSYRAPDGSAGEGHILGMELPGMPLSEHAADVALERLRVEVAAAVDEAWARRGSRDRAVAHAALAVIKRRVLAARDERRAPGEGLAELLDHIALAENAIARSAAEREHARRSLRERSHMTLLGHSGIRPLPDPDEE